MNLSHLRSGLDYMEFIIVEGSFDVLTFPINLLDDYSDPTNVAHEVLSETLVIDQALRMILYSKLSGSHHRVRVKESCTCKTRQVLAVGV